MVFGSDGEMLVRAEARAEVYSRPSRYVRIRACYTFGYRFSGMGGRSKRAGLAWSTLKRPPEPLGYVAMRKLSRIWNQNAHLQVPRLP